MRRLVTAAVAVLLVLGVASGAQALTTKELIELAKAGLGEEVLLALIEVDRGVYAIDPASIKALKEAGASDRVIAAVVRSGREQPAPQPVAVPPAPMQEEPIAPAPQPQVVVIEHDDPAPREVMVPVPVYVTSPSAAHRRGKTTQTTPATEFIPFQSGPPAVRPVAKEPAKPVYWGFGGNRRPDAWDPPASEKRHEGAKGKGGSKAKDK